MTVRLFRGCGPFNSVVIPTGGTEEAETCKNGVALLSTEAAANIKPSLCKLLESFKQHDSCASFTVKLLFSLYLYLLSSLFSTLVGISRKFPCLSFRIREEGVKARIWGVEKHASVVGVKLIGLDEAEGNADGGNEGKDVVAAWIV
ncbi:protein phosphatase 2 (formerly 2A), catalytic subunit/protein-tyrosine phosphatase, partial [Trypanosoma cruzi]